MSVRKFLTSASTIATLTLTLAVAAPVASPASAAPVLGTPISLPASSSPYSVAVSPDGSKAYVANYAASKVSVVTVATGALGTPISLPASSFPYSVAFSPDGSKAYVANYSASSVSVITVATDTVASTIPLPGGSRPYSVAFSPDGSKAYVVNQGTSKVSVITVATDSVASTISLPADSSPRSVAFSPDGSRAYVANLLTSTVSVIAVASGTLETPITLPGGSRPYSVAFSPDGSRAYVANSSTSTVSVIATGVASAPLSLVAETASPSSVSVSWAAPSPLGGETVTDYLVQFKASSASRWSTFSHAPSVATAATVTGLSAATSYDFRVAAITVDGTSPYSTPLTASTLSDVTSVPRTLVAGTTTTTSVALSWVAPATLNGGVINDYVIQYKASGASSWSTFEHAASVVTAATVAGLTPGTTYQFHVAAVTEEGTSEYSALVTKTTLTALSGITSVPRTLSAGTTTAASVALRWTAPVSLNGGVITDYLIQYRKTGSSTWLTFAHTASAATTRTVTGLLARTSYQFQVAAKTAAGTSPWATVAKTTLAR